MVILSTLRYGETVSKSALKPSTPQGLENCAGSFRDDLGSSTSIPDTILRCNPLFFFSRQYELWKNGTFSAGTNFIFKPVLKITFRNFKKSSLMTDE
jgi:hypothetical protein